MKNKYTQNFWAAVSKFLFALIVIHICGLIISDKLDDNFYQNFWNKHNEMLNYCRSFECFYSAKYISFVSISTFLITIIVCVALIIKIAIQKKRSENYIGIIVSSVFMIILYSYSLLNIDFSFNKSGIYTSSLPSGWYGVFRFPLLALMSFSIAISGYFFEKMNSDRKEEM